MRRTVSGYGKRIVSVKERNLNMRISTLLTRMHETNLLLDKEFAVKDPSRLPIPTQKEETSREGGLFYLDLHESFGEHCRFINNEGFTIP